jgi:hypothetical protein
VRVIADIIGKIAELSLQACGVSVEGLGRVSLRDLFGSAWVPAEAAAVIRQALQKMLEAGDVCQTNRWQAIEFWAFEYLSGTPGESQGEQ